MKIIQTCAWIAPSLAGLFLLQECLWTPFHGAYAQVVPDATLGSESSIVIPNATVRGNVADLIEGGAVRGSALFHSFQDFNVNNGQRVYFANPNGIENILGRVTGLNASQINGLLGVNGSANLFLINPNGIVFGPNAQLDVAGAFLASTSDRFRFGDGSEFRATNPNEAPPVTVNIPLGLQLGPNAPAALVSSANLSAGRDLTLSAGSVTSTGHLAAPNGTIRITGTSGDVRVQSVTAQSAVLQASKDLVLEESNLTTIGDMSLVATDTVRIRDSAETPFVANAGGNLRIQGNAGIDILALNHLEETPFRSGGNLTLVSDGIISGDAHFDSGGNFEILNAAGNAGTFVSLYDPVIRANGNITFGDYAGQSLLVEASGSITTGKITITGPDTNTAALNAPALALSAGDIDTLTNKAAVILRAGVNPALTDTSLGVPVGDVPTIFNKTPANGNNIVIGGDITANDTTAPLVPGYIELTAPGSITLNGNLTANNNGQVLLQGNTVIGNNPISIMSNQVNFSNTVNINGKALTVSADEINLNNTVTPGGGSLTLAPLTASQNISLGGNADSGPGVLDLTANELGRLNSNNFSQITIGRADGTGTVNLSALTDNAFQSPVKLAGGSTLQGPNNPSNWLIGSSSTEGSLDLNQDGTGDITFQNFETVQGSTGNNDKLVGTSGSDTFTITDTANSVRSNDVTFNNIGTVNALEGTNTVEGTVNGDTFTLTNTDNRVLARNITFNSIGIVNASGETDTVQGTSDDETFTITDTPNSVLARKITFSNIETVNASGGTDTVQGTDSTDAFTITGANRVQTGSVPTVITFNDVEAINALGGDDTVIFGSPTFNGTIAGGSGNLTIQGDEIDFGGAVSGSGDLLIRPTNPSRRILLGGNNADDLKKDLEINNSDISRLQNGFSSITFSNSNSDEGQIIVGDSITFQDPLILQAGNTVTVNKPIAVAENDSITLQGSTVDINANVTARSGNIDVFGNNITIDDAILNASGSATSTIRIGSGIGADNEPTPANSVRINKSNATVDAGNDPTNGGTLKIAVSSSSGFTYNPSRLLARVLILPVPGTNDLVVNGIIFGENITIQRGDGSGPKGLGLTVNGANAPYGFLPDGDGGYYFSDVFVETFHPLGSGLVYFAQDTFTIKDLLDNLNVGTEISAFWAGNAFEMFGGDTIVAQGNFQIASIGSTGDSATVAAILKNPSSLDASLSSSVVLGRVISNGGSISLASLGSLTAQGLLTATGDITAAAADALTLQAGATTSSGNAQFTAAGNLEVSGSGASITTTGQKKEVNLSAGGTLTVIGTGTGIETRNGNVRLESGDTLTVTGDGANIRTNGGNVNFASADHLAVSGTGAGIVTQGGSVELSASKNGITLGSDINSSPAGSTRGGNIQVTADKGNVEITSALSSQNAASNPNSFSEIKIEAFDGDVILSAATITAASPNATVQGLAGNILINASDEIQILNSSKLSTDGALGRIYIGPIAFPDQNTTTPVPTLVNIDNSSLTTTNEVINGKREAGNIQVRSDRLNISNSTIRADTSGNANAGSITIATRGDNNNATTDLTIQNSEILATSNPSQDRNATNIATGNAGTISLTAQDGDIELIEGSRVASDTKTAGNSGNVTVEANNLSVMEGSVVQARSLGTGAPGNIDVIVPGSVQIDGINANGRLSELSTFAGASASSSSTGTITIRGSNGAQPSPTHSIDLTNRGRINALTASNVANQVGGNIDITVDQLRLASGGQIIASSVGKATAGNILVNAIEGVDIQGSAISFQSLFGSPAIVRPIGDVQPVLNNDKLQSLTLTSGEGAVLADTLAGFLGLDSNVISAQEGSGVQIEANGTLSFTWSFSTDEAPNNFFNDFSFQSVNGTLKRLADTNSSTLSQGTVVPLGQSSNISFGVVDVGDRSVDSTLEITNITLNGAPIRALLPQEDVQLSSSFISGISASGRSGTGGNVTVNAPQITVQDGGAIAASAEDGVAGNITLTTGNLNVLNGGRINVSSNPDGAAGGLNITANSILLDNGRLTAETGANPKGTADSARITLNMGNSASLQNILRLRNESLISATATGGTASGGNIDITAGFIIGDAPTGPAGSDITANAGDGPGGNIRINALGVLGLQVRPQLTPLNDITASSEKGVQGTVVLNTLATDPNSGLVELSLDFVDASGQTVNQCSADGANAGSEIRVAGRGGLPSMPTAILGAVPSDDGDWVTLSQPTSEAAMSSVVATLDPTLSSSHNPHPSLCHRAYQASQTPT